MTLETEPSKSEVQASKEADKCIVMQNRMVGLDKWGPHPGQEWKIALLQAGRQRETSLPHQAEVEPSVILQVNYIPRHLL